MDGIAKHRTGNASRNGHIADMDIRFRGSPGVERIWRFFHEAAAKDLNWSSIFDFSTTYDFTSRETPPTQLRLRNCPVM